MIKYLKVRIKRLSILTISPDYLNLKERRTLLKMIRDKESERSIPLYHLTSVPKRLSTGLEPGSSE